MDDIIEISSDMSSFIEEEDEEDYSQSNLSQDLSVTHNNNGSLIEQQVLTINQVIGMMEREMQKVMDITDLSANKVRSLLNDFKWDSTKLIETFYEGGKKAQELMKNNWKVFPVDIRKSLDCEICFEKLSNPAKILKFQCNNRFCVDCFSDYVTQIVKDGGGLLVTAIKCPGYECNFELDDADVLQVLTDSKLKLKFLQIVANCFVQNNDLIKWCPNANCENAVLLEFSPTPHGDSIQLFESVRCSCGFWFCFLCHCNSHDPVPCEMLVEWSKVREEDLEAQQWILLHTKPCPGCRSNIEKQGGCMHMTCSKCKHQFCWVCMGLWSSSHNCGRNDAVNPPVEHLKSIRRFSSYNAKHETMKQAYSMDVVQYKHKLVQGTELELDTQWIKTDFVAQAVEILLQCRRTLMHSYIFSYFMTTLDNQMYIFEENLKYLEQCTEQLSEVLEDEVTRESFKAMKFKIIDGTVLCTKRRRSLMDHIREGYDKNWWRKFPISHDELVEAERRVGEEAIQRLLY